MTNIESDTALLTAAAQNTLTSDDVILVTGATGMTGGQVVRQLCALREHGGRHFEIRALVRDPATASLPDGVLPVRGDLTDPDSLTGGSGELSVDLAEVTRIFLVWPTMRADHVAERVIGLFGARAERIVYLSSAGAGAESPGDPVNRSHARLERLIRDATARWTFLRGGGFARNDLGWAPEIASGVVREAFAGWARSVVHEADLAAVGVRALVTDELLNTATGTLTGPESLSQAERVAILSEVVGRRLAFEEVPVERARADYLAWLPPEAVDETIAAMVRMIAEPERVSGEVERILGRPALGYRRWALDHVGDFTGGSTAGIASAYAAMIRQGEFDVIRGQLYAPDFARTASDELDGPPVELAGEAVWRNAERNAEREEITGVVVDEPYIGVGHDQPDGRFAIRFTFDAVDRATGAALHYPKVSVYTVRDGLVVHEHVFLDRPVDAR